MAGGPRGDVGGWEKGMSPKVCGRGAAEEGCPRRVPHGPSPQLAGCVGPGNKGAQHSPELAPSARAGCRGHKALRWPRVLVLGGGGEAAWEEVSWPSGFIHHLPIRGQLTRVRGGGEHNGGAGRPNVGKRDRKDSFTGWNTRTRVPWTAPG